MLVTFAIDEEALKITKGNELILVPAHERLLYLWARLGVLMLDSNVKNAVQGLPQSLRKAWKTALSVNRVESIPVNWKGFSEVSSGVDLVILNERVDLACLEDRKADCVGVPSAKVSCQPEGLVFEVCRFACADQSNAFKGARYLADEGILKGTLIEEIWDKRFSKLARLCKHVTVVDRYAVKEMCEGTGIDQSGLENFLCFLGRQSYQYSTRIYAAKCSDMTETAIRGSVARLFESINRNIFRQLTICLVEERTFKARIHDRWIRFDNTVCEIGIGVSLFKGNVARSASTFTAKPRTGFNRACENFLWENSFEAGRLESDLQGTQG